ncbi:hypothetical protein C8J56DRAFT_954578 [Mycena floridula]|nr:hypothetical protein C8J56DRAFT_954578 [Mycena floridula]
MAAHNSKIISQKFCALVFPPSPFPFFVWVHHSLAPADGRHGLIVSSSHYIFFPLVPSFLLARYRVCFA